MRFTLEPSPAGGYLVRMEGSEAPLSHHDTLEEAEARAAAYERGVTTPPGGELVDLPDGSEVLVRPVTPDDKPLFVAAWEGFGELSRYRRFLAAKKQLSPSEGERDRRLHRLAVHRQPQHDATVRAARPRPGARHAGRDDGDRRRAAG